MTEQAAVEIYAHQKQPIVAALPKHIFSLTSTRFIAAFSIVLYHFKDHMGFVDINNYTYILKNSYVGVDFFFILSGFIMAHSYASQIRDGKFVFFDFIKRRFARVYPVHFVTLLAFCGLGFVFFMLDIKPNIPEKYAIEAVPINLFLLQAWGLTQEGTFNTPSWSISAEWLAYLLFFPFSLLLFRLNAFAALALAVLLLCGFYFGTPLLTGDPMTGLAHRFGILRIIPEFFYGIAVYLFLCRAIPSQRVSHFLWFGGALALIGCLHFSAPDLITIFLFGLLIYALGARSCYGQNNLLDKRIMVYGGEISYSMYMVHALIYTVTFNGADIVFKNQTPNIEAGMWLFAVLAVFPAAMLCFHFIEEPGRKFINSRFNRP
ncbi:MAG: hypothetical protein A3B66_06945 [Alphaproteobacteria bacterium RIFCSPHIGHO2_02_FULL_46_13]|nr:MAG: hypothetical protein A3B66_06945 [Alphaproteobacteria bacterium RIFCSPHIGHO2_02_FULL_46_13]